jgi:hypothetical protein
MNSLALTFRNLPSNGRIGRMTLSQCLDVFGMPKHAYIGPHGNRQNKYLTFSLRRLNQWQLQDLFESAHEHWIAGCKIIQTQFEKNHGAAAAWNALWLRIKFLFKKRGTI